MTLRRQDLQRWFMEPFFESHMPGCLVRIARRGQSSHRRAATQATLPPLPCAASAPHCPALPLPYCLCPPLPCCVSIPVGARPFPFGSSPAGAAVHGHCIPPSYLVGARF